MYALEIKIHTHHFCVTPRTEYAQACVMKFCNRLFHRPFSSDGRTTPPKLFASVRSDMKEFRFVIGILRAFRQYVDDIGFIDGYSCEFAGVPVAADVQFTLKGDFALRDYQIQVKDFILTRVDAEYGYSRLVTMATGTGKTVTALISAAELGKRIAVVVLAKYVDKWIADAQEVYDIDPKRIMAVQGAKYLKGMLNMGVENKLDDIDIIVISMQTLAPFYDTYEEYGDSFEDYGFPIRPDAIFSACGVGTVIIDETHEHIHLVHRLMSYMHVSMTIGLSATFQSDEQFIERIHKAMFPHEVRINTAKMKKYIHLNAVAYNFRHFERNKIRINNWGSNSYSHLEFEKSILKYGDYSNNYMRMVESFVRTGYIDDYKPKDKCLVFAARVEMVNKIAKHLAKIYPHLKVSTYVKDDDYSVLTDADIIVSTLGSSGTAVDIKGLTAVLMTTSINNSVPNLQALGRLREITGRIVRFYYFYCEQIPKQVEYHQNKIPLFRDRIQNYCEFISDIMI